MDLDAIKKRAEQFVSSSQPREKIDYTKIYWRPTEGEHQIRIVPSKFNSSTPFTEAYIHYGIGKFPIFSLKSWGEKDPIVEYVRALNQQSGDEEVKKLAQTLSPNLRIFAPVIVRGEEDKGVRLWQFGVKLYQQFLNYATDDEIGDFTDITDGVDFKVTGIKTQVGNRTAVTCMVTPKRKDSVLSQDPEELKEWLENQPNVLEVQRKPTYDYLKEALNKYLNPEEEDKGEEGDTVASTETETDENNFELSTAAKPKVNKEKKFDELFAETSK